MAVNPLRLAVAVEVEKYITQEKNTCNWSQPPEGTSKLTIMDLNNPHGINT